MGLEELRILFLSMRVTALLPHSIILDEKSFRSLRFPCGWRCGVTWWFGIFALVEAVWLIGLAVNILMDLVRKTESLIYMSVLFIWEISYLFARLTPSVFVIHAARFKKVLKTFEKVDRVLEDIPQRKSSTVQRRTVIGLVIGFFLVKYMIRL